MIGRVETRHNFFRLLYRKCIIFHELAGDVLNYDCVIRSMKYYPEYVSDKQSNVHENIFSLSTILIHMLHFFLTAAKRKKKNGNLFDRIQRI